MFRLVGGLWHNPLTRWLIQAALIILVWEFLRSAILILLTGVLYLGLFALAMYITFKIMFHGVIPSIFKGNRKYLP
jgi:hypothetical protein